MPGFLVEETASVQCPHGAKATIVSVNKRVKIDGVPVALVNDATTVGGCPFQVPIGTGTKPQPCVKVVWLVPAIRVKVMNQAVLVKTSGGQCQSAEQIPQGPPVVAMTQVRVSGT